MPKVFQLYLSKQKFMNTEILNNLKMIAETARDFAEVNIRPHIMEWDESQTFPVDLFHKLGEMGFMGIIIPEEYGGSGLGYHEYVTILDEISQVDPSIGLSVAAHNSLCTNHIYEFGNEEQRKKWLPKLASGQVIGAWGLTEHNTGSDAGGIPEIVSKDVGWIFPSRDSAALAQTISSAFSNTKQLDMMRPACRRRAEKLYTLDGMLEKYKCLYEELCRNNA